MGQQKIMQREIRPCICSLESGVSLCVEVFDQSHDHVLKPARTSRFIASCMDRTRDQHPKCVPTTDIHQRECVKRIVTCGTQRVVQWFLRTESALVINEVAEIGCDFQFDPTLQQRTSRMHIEAVHARNQ
jgi:hypothetical protein